MKETIPLQSANNAAGAQPMGQSGFSLIELLISLITFGIVLAAIYGLLEVGRSDRFVTNQRVEALQSVRNALNAVGRDAYNAGYNYPLESALLPKNTLSALVSGVGVRNNATADFLTPVIAANNVTTNALSGAQTDQVTFVYQDVTFNNNQSLPIQSIKADGAEVTLAAGFTNAACRVNDLYILAGVNNQSIGVMTATVPGNKINFNAGDGLNLNRPSPPNTSNFIKNAGVPASLYKVSMVTFHVLQNGTLMRTVYGNDSTVAQQSTPLAYNIEDMIIEYVLNTGAVKVNPTPAEFSKICQVRVTINARSPEQSSRIKDANGQPAFFRVTATSVFNTRNISYLQ